MENDNTPTLQETSTKKYLPAYKPSSEKDAPQQQTRGQMGASSSLMESIILQKGEMTITSSGPNPSTEASKTQPSHVPSVSSRHQNKRQPANKGGQIMTSACSQSAAITQGNSGLNSAAHANTSTFKGISTSNNNATAMGHKAVQKLSSQKLTEGKTSSSHQVGGSSLSSQNFMGKESAFHEQHSHSRSGKGQKGHLMKGHSGSAHNSYGQKSGALNKRDGNASIGSVAGLGSSNRRRSFTKQPSSLTAGGQTGKQNNGGGNLRHMSNGGRTKVLKHQTSSQESTEAPTSTHKNKTKATKEESFTHATELLHIAAGKESEYKLKNLHASKQSSAGKGNGQGQATTPEKNGGGHSNYKRNSAHKQLNPINKIADSSASSWHNFENNIIATLGSSSKQQQPFFPDIYRSGSNYLAERGSGTGEIDGNLPPKILQKGTGSNSSATRAAQSMGPQGLNAMTSSSGTNACLFTEESTSILSRPVGQPVAGSSSSNYYKIREYGKGLSTSQVVPVPVQMAEVGLQQTLAPQQSSMTGSKLHTSADSSEEKYKYDLVRESNKTTTTSQLRNSKKQNQTNIYTKRNTEMPTMNSRLVYKPQSGIREQTDGINDGVSASLSPSKKSNIPTTSPSNKNLTPLEQKQQTSSSVNLLNSPLGSGSASKNERKTPDWEDFTNVTHQRIVLKDGNRMISQMLANSNSPSGLTPGSLSNKESFRNQDSGSVISGLINAYTSPGTHAKTKNLSMSGADKGLTPSSPTDRGELLKQSSGQGPSLIQALTCPRDLSSDNKVNDHANDDNRRRVSGISQDSYGNDTTPSNHVVIRQASAACGGPSGKTLKRKLVKFNSHKAARKATVMNVVVPKETALINQSLIGNAVLTSNQGMHGQNINKNSMKQLNSVSGANAFSNPKHSIAAPVSQLEGAEMKIPPFKDVLDYSKYMQPKTDRVFQFKSKRFDFCRRPSHKDKQVMIIQFEGVIGDFMKKSPSEEGTQLKLRHGAADGLRELQKNFQIALYTFLGEKTIQLAVEYLLREEDIVFDGIYRRLPAFKSTDEYANYNQIYADFEIIHVNDQEEVESERKIEENVILVAPICLTHDEIKHYEGEDLIVHQEYEDYAGGSMLTCRGLPIESDKFVPMIFLVPHQRSQNHHYAVSLLNISNILISTLMTAWTDTPEIRQEVQKVQIRELDIQRRTLIQIEKANQQGESISPPRSPTKLPINAVKRGSLIMTFTTISPKNQYRKLINLAKDKQLTQETCSWIRAFQNVKRHKLFQLKVSSSIKLQPQMARKRRQEELLRLKMSLYKLKSYVRQLQGLSGVVSQPAVQSQIQRQLSHKAVNSIGRLNQQARIDEVVGELLAFNGTAREFITTYHQSFYQNVMTQHFMNSPAEAYNLEILQSLIGQMESRVKDLQSPGVTAESITKVPIYRFLVVLGHEFQLYPPEVKKTFKAKHTSDQNLVKWILTNHKGPAPAYHPQVPKSKAFNAQCNPVTHVNMFQSQQQPTTLQSTQMQRQNSSGVQHQHETHFMPGKYSIFSQF